MRELGLLALRAATGGLLAGHGAQKLFGAFEGPGLTGTAGFMEMLGLKPGRVWGTTAAVAEFGGGTLTALGLLNPLGPLGIMSAMAMASATAHWGKPIWAAKGGAELAVTNFAAALAVATVGPGAYSLDHALGIKLPPAVVAIAALSTGGMLAYGIAMVRRAAPPPPPGPAAETTLQSGESAR